MRLYAAGWSLAQISEHLGVTARTVGLRPPWTRRNDARQPW
ncbi:MAG: helix-turn-helix domain-containing protein [Pseudonocardiales bacterium]